MRLFQQPTPAWRDLGFLAMALVVHIALLMLPMKAWQTHKPDEGRNQTPNEPLTVQLQPARNPAPETVVKAPVGRAQIEDQNLPPLERKPAADYTLAEIPLPQDSVVTDAQQTSETATSQTLSTKQLRLWAEQAGSLDPLRETSQILGTARLYQPPANWNRNAGAAFFASFDDRSHEPNLPADVTVVDRWQAADGSHQVVVQLPTGESLCGRAAPHDPMQPLVEHIMMFRVCGNTPTFTMPDHYKKGR